MILENLFNAIYNKWVGDGTYGLTAFYNTEADSESVYPYGVFSLVSAVPEWTFAEDFEGCLVDIRMFDDDPECEDISNAMKALQAAFDFFDLDITGYSPVKLERVFSNLSRIENVWRYLVTYQFLIQKI